MKTFTPEQLKSLTVDFFVNLGAPKKDAKICAEVLVTADKWGLSTHGVSRLKECYYKRIKSGAHTTKTKIEIIRNKKATTLIDANHGLGHVASLYATNLTIQKAKQFGIAITAVKNSSHYGIAGYYAYLAAKQNLIFFSSTNTRPGVAPLFGVENILGTNPIAIGIPSNEPFPFLLDIATSITQRGKIEAYARSNKRLPQGWIIDHSGKTITNPQEALKKMTANQAALIAVGGTTETEGGHKGYGLSMAVEILTTALPFTPFLGLSQTANAGLLQTGQLGHIFVAIDPAAFVDLKDFKKTTTQIIKRLRSSKRAKPNQRIYTPGEKEYLHLQKTKQNGITLDAATRKELRSLIKEMNLNKYRSWF